MCPLERKNKSSFFPSIEKSVVYSITSWYKQVINSAQPKEPPGCPEFTL